MQPCTPPSNSLGISLKKNDLSNSGCSWSYVPSTSFNYAVDFDSHWEIFQFLIIIWQEKNHTKQRNITNICAKVLRQGLLRCLSIYNAKDGILNWLYAFINCLQGTKLTMNDLTVMELSNWPFCCCNQTFHAIAKFRMFKSPTTKTFLPYQTEGWHDQQTWTLHFNFLILSMRNSIAPASSSLMKPLHTPLDLPNKQIFVGGTMAAKVWIIGTKNSLQQPHARFQAFFYQQPNLAAINSYHGRYAIHLQEAPATFGSHASTWMPNIKVN